MPDQRTDVVVVGAGVFGLATALELARRGRTVTVIDRFGSGHRATSSTGASRSIRIAYGEPFYVDLARDALDRWAALERATGMTILQLTGQVDLGPESVLDALVESVAAAGATLERRTAAELRESFPELSDGRGGLFHAQAGTVMAAVGMEALRLAAVDAGVRLLMPERVMAIEPGEPAVVQTDKRTVEADRVVIAAGPWTGGMLEPLGIGPAPGPVGRPGDVPRRADDGRPTRHRRLAGARLASASTAIRSPASGTSSPSTPASTVGSQTPRSGRPTPTEEARILGWMDQHLGGAPQRVAYSQRHPWTLTPDSDFVIDRRGSLVLACGCSGHAFKFGPALGPVVADVVEGAPPHPLFRLDRPGLTDPVSPASPIAR